MCVCVFVRQDSREKDSACVLENERRKQTGSLISVSHGAAKKNPERKLVFLVSAGDATHICLIVTHGTTQRKIQIISSFRDVAVDLFHSQQLTLLLWWRDTGGLCVSQLRK